jgi:long-chain acyl-CoA synthetase
MPQTLNTINRRFADAARRYANLPALSSKKGEDWGTLTYAEVGSRVRRFALGLQARGIQTGDRVALISENRSEWVIADLGALAAGAVTVPLYPTLPAAQIAPLLADSGAKAVIVSDARQLKKVFASRAQTPDLKIVITMEASAATEDAVSFETIMREGDAVRVDELALISDAVSPSDLMSIIYTSGTTGIPKGVMLTHDNMCATLDGARENFTQFQPPNETFLSFLPLSHIFERVLSCLALTTGAQTYYNDSIFKLMDNMVDAKPTVMVNVPRVFESMHERILAEAAKMPESRRRWFEWAIEVGEHTSARQRAGKSLGPLWPVQRALADRMVLSKIRAKFGGHLKFFVSGGAPLNPQTGAFFQALGMPILEGYGLTETTGPAAANRTEQIRLGTVGPAFPGCTVRLADDGELLVQGRSIMRGYWNQPEATAEVLDSQGWFHTGDIGEIASDGSITITDRKKDLLVLANGKKVAPQPIELLLKRSPWIADIVLLGDGSSTVSALILPDFERLKAWCKEQGKDIKDIEGDSDVRRLFKKEIDGLSSDLADFERVKRLALLPAPLTIEGGELTPTLKIRRRAVAEKYGQLLERDGSSG